eukprot:Phypoly_transcript_16930.p1 GENE.Phypoly_transcript_16930~~Phypoly_transcript_16930.p1  ORF type:complete len:176 (+),score=32.86 Phypoly_transcript_16930:59-529(+)
MASEEFYGDGGGDSDGSGSEFDDEPFDVQSPLEKMRLILHSLDTAAPSEELTKHKEEAKHLLEYLKELEAGDMSHIEDFRTKLPAVVQFASKLPSYEIFYDDLVNIYEDRVDDAENAAEKEKYKNIIKQLKAHDASSITDADKDLVYKNLVESFMS